MGFALSLEAGPTWLTTIPPMSLSNTGSATLNALGHPTLSGKSDEWFPGGALDGRITFRNSDVFIPFLGFRLGFVSFEQNLALGHGVTAGVENFVVGEVLLPGIGVRLGEHCLFSTRLFYVDLATEGSATNGRVTVGVSADAGGVGVAGDASACSAGTFRVCAFVQPLAMYIGTFDVGANIGLRFELERKK